MQKQNPSSVSGHAVDLAHTLIKAKSPFANILYSKLGKASQQAKFHLPGEIQTCNFLVAEGSQILNGIFVFGSSKESCQSPCADVLCHARATKMFGLFGLIMVDLCQVAQL